MSVVSWVGEDSADPASASGRYRFDRDRKFSMFVCVVFWMIFAGGGVLCRVFVAKGCVGVMMIQFTRSPVVE